MRKENLIISGIVFFLISAGILFFVSQKIGDSYNSKQTKEKEKIVEQSENEIENVNENFISEEEGKLANQKLLNEKEVTVESSEEEIAIAQKGEESFQSNIIENNGELGDLYKNMQEDYYENLSKKKNISELKKYQEGTTIKKDFEIYVMNKDSKESMSDVNVFLWGHFIGKTNEEGVVIKKDIEIPSNMDYYYIQVNKKGSLPGFRYIYKEDTEDIVRDIFFIKDAISIKGQDSNNIDINEENFKIKLEGECNFEDINGECYNGKVDVDVVYILPNEIDELNFPMRAIYSDTNFTSYLQSAGMDFTEFYDENGNLLNYTKKERITICHRIDAAAREEERLNLEEVKKDGGEVLFDDMWNYRWFDKSKGIWIAGTDAIKSVDGEFQCYKTFNP